MFEKNNLLMIISYGLCNQDWKHSKSFDKINEASFIPKDFEKYNERP